MGGTDVGCVRDPADWDWRLCEDWGSAEVLSATRGPAPWGLCLGLGLGLGLGAGLPAAPSTPPSMQRREL